MFDLRSFPKESKLPDAFIARLDDLSARATELHNETERTNCLLALSNFYWMTSESKRACSLTDFLIDKKWFSGVRVGRHKPSVHAATADTLSAWELQERRGNLARAHSFVQKDEAEQAIDELLECRGLLYATNARDELAEFMSLTWLALAEKLAGAHSSTQVSQSDLLRGIFYDRSEHSLPGSIRDATSYIAKSWHLFALGDINTSQEMLKSVVIPRLQAVEAHAKQWAGCWIKAYGIEALLAATRCEADLVLEALSKTHKVAIDSHDPVNAKFQLLICMEAMEMLSKPTEATDAQARFLENDEDPPIDVRTSGERRDTLANTHDVESAVEFVSAKAFVRTMAAIAWSSFRHPFTTTFVDISTGDVIQEVIE